MISRKAAKSSGSSQSVWRYLAASLGVLGGACGRFGQRQKMLTVLVFRHSAMCKGVLRRPQVHLRVALCRRPSAVVNLNCVTNRIAQGPRYKLSYDARIQDNTHSS